MLPLKNLYDFDVTLGLGWGLLGTQGGISSPLNFLDKSFEIENQILVKEEIFLIKAGFQDKPLCLGAIEYDLKENRIKTKA